MIPTDQRPARLYNQGGNTVLAIPRAHCRKLGLLPGHVVAVHITEDGGLYIYQLRSWPNERTPIRKRPT